MREFNVIGDCRKEENYIVDITEKINQITKLVVEGKYFAINRARQYGKTTTIRFLSEKLKEKYIVIRTTFEGLSDVVFENDKNFNMNFIKKIIGSLKTASIDKSVISDLENNRKNLMNIDDLGDEITKFTLEYCNKI